MKIQILANQINKALRLIILFCLVFLAASCNGLVATPIPDVEATVFGDCYWEAAGKTWVDDNQNGVWDIGEKPLANVKFLVEDTLNDYHEMMIFESGITNTDSNGNIQISIWLAGCPEVEFEIYTEAQPNCRHTTQERISVNYDDLYPVYSFGFICQ